MEEQTLLPGVDAGTIPLRYRRHPWCHLWTFTFPDDVGPAEALQRWRHLSDKLVRAGKRCVRVVERGKKGERRWHVHAVTPQRWSVQWLRPLAEHYGFGRINVKRIPAEKAGYVAKYLAKDLSRDQEIARVRKWAAVGFDGCSVRNLRKQETVDRSGDWSISEMVDAVTWSWDGECQLTDILRGKHARPVNTAPTIKHMEFKKMQADEILKTLATGACLFVGEYRGFVVRTLKLADKRTGAFTDRVVVEHNVECAGAARTVAEWLPAGADAKATVKPAAGKGELVVVHVETAKRFGGQLSYGGTIKPLTALV